MEDSMCWEMDYWYYAEQEKAKKAKAREERDVGVIKNLLNGANQEADKPTLKRHPSKKPCLRNSGATTTA
jgi:hypothetical protein